MLAFQSQEFLTGDSISNTSRGVFTDFLKRQTARGDFATIRRPVKEIKKGYGILKDTILIPHHNTFGHSWPSVYFDTISDIRCIGVDEQTGMINQDGNRRWTVYGRGKVTLYFKSSVVTYDAGQTFQYR